MIKILELVRKIPVIPMVVALLLAVVLHYVADDGTTFQQWSDIYLAVVTLLALGYLSGKTKNTRLLSNLYIVTAVFAVAYIIASVIVPFTVVTIILGTIFGVTGSYVVILGLIYDLQNLKSQKDSDA